MLFLFFACTTGSNYPRKNATATCKTGYACIDQDVIEDFLGYDSIDECINDLEGQIQSTDGYKDYENGSKDFYVDNANACLQEILDVQNDSDCDGNMDVFSFFFDVFAEECSEVYQ